MYSPHSEQLTVPLADGIREKGIREFTWKLHLPHREHEAWVGLVKAGFGDFDDPVTRRRREREAARRADAPSSTATSSATAPACPSRRATRSISPSGGERAPAGRRPRAATSSIAPDPMYAAYVDAGTSMNASIAAQLLLAGAAKPGVWAPEEIFDVRAYVAEMRKRNFNVSLHVAEA